MKKLIKFSLAVLAVALQLLMPLVAQAANPTINVILDDLGRIDTTVIAEVGEELFATKQDALDAAANRKYSSSKAVADYETALGKARPYIATLKALKGSSSLPSAETTALDTILATIDSMLAKPTDFPNIDTQLTTIQTNLSKLSGKTTDSKKAQGAARDFLKLMKTPGQALSKAYRDVATANASWAPDAKGIDAGLAPKLLHHSKVDPFWTVLLERETFFVIGGNNTPIELKASTKVPDHFIGGQVVRDPVQPGRMTLATTDAWLLDLTLSKKKALTCKFLDGDGKAIKEPGGKCSVAYTPGTRALVQFLGDPRLGFVSAVELSGQKSDNSQIPDLASLPVQSCSFTSTGYIRELIPGAARQLVQISSPDCSGVFAQVSGLRLVGQGATLKAQVVPTAAGSDPRIRIVDIPSTMTRGLAIFELKSAHDAFLGSIALNVANDNLGVELDSSSNPRLAVRYVTTSSEENGHRRLLDWHTGESKDGAAVVSRTPESSAIYVANSPLWKPVPSALGSADLMPPAEKTCTRPERSVDYQKWHQKWQDCLRETRPWSVEVLGWEVGQRIELSDSDDQWTNGEALYLSDLNHFQFVALSQWNHDLTVEAALSQIESIAPDKRQRTEWVAARVVIAKQARMESLPIPIASAIRIECKKSGWFDKHGSSDVALDGTSKGVSGDTLSAGECRIGFDPEMVFGEHYQARADAYLAFQLLKDRVNKEKAYAQGRASHCQSDEQSASCLEMTEQAAKVADLDALERKDRALHRAEETLKEALRKYNKLCPEASCIHTLSKSQEINDLEKVRDEKQAAFDDTLKTLNIEYQKVYESWRELRDQRSVYRERLQLVGIQDLEVKIERDGVAPKTFLWRLDPSMRQDIALPAMDDKSANGPYMVTVVNALGMPLVAVARPPSTGLASTSGLVASGFTFKAHLRPRTKGALSNRWRMFATIPIDPLAVRFPARSNELKSSGDIKGAQLAQVRTGIAVALEPWNYDTGKHGWAIPMRFEVGSYLFTMSDKVFNPALFTGFKIVLPLIDLPDGHAKDQLGTDATLGFLCEVPVDYWHPHFLITLGVDALTLFGSK